MLVFMGIVFLCVHKMAILHHYRRYNVILVVFFKDLPEPTKPTVPRPLLSLCGIIYVTWYTSGLPEATGVRLRLPNSHALLGSGRP